MSFVYTSSSEYTSFFGLGGTGLVILISSVFTVSAGLTSSFSGVGRDGIIEITSLGTDGTIETISSGAEISISTL